MENKRTYTTEDIDELKEWFGKMANRLPESMQIDSSAYAPSLKDTVNMLLEQAYICCENPKMQGCVNLLKKIKKNLEETE